MSNEYIGFSAQNIQVSIPEAISTSPNGYLSLQDRPIIATIINAIKDIVNIAGEFKNRLIAWIGDSGNGIGKIFSKRNTNRQKLVFKIKWRTSV